MSLPNATKCLATALGPLVALFLIGLPVHAQSPPANVETADVPVAVGGGAKTVGAKTLYYNMDTFYVPFTTSPGISDDLTAREMLLFVSGDQGASWQLYQRQSPSAKRFAFRAAVDGEFWFAVRTMFGETEPAAKDLEPELKVILDTEKPRLEVSATLLTEVQAGATWRISDANLEANSLRMEYRTSPNGIWHPIMPGKIYPIENGFSGESTWQLPEPAAVIELRAQVKDRSGNTASVQDKINLPTPARTAASGEMVPRQPIASAVNAGTEAATSQANAATGQANADIPWQTQRAPHAVVANRNADSGWRSLNRQTLEGNAPMGSRTFQPHVTAARTATGSVHPPTTAGEGARPLSTPSRRLPAPTQAHMSQSRQFHLDYDVESTDRSRIASVALWATADNGAHWYFYGNDDDRESPFLVNVDTDALYGFRLLIEGSDGIAPRPPRNGDSADVWIHVDSTPPKARLVAARFGRNAHLGQLQIHWDAEDENLATQPVTLLYSDQRQGPWRVIAEQLANSGRYDWTVRENVPAEFYLQLEVQDRAGNISRDSLRDPISRDGFAPRGVIRDVRPAADSAFNGSLAVPD